MDRSTFFKALAVIIVITLVSAGILFFFYSRGNDDYEGIPTIYPYVNDDAGVLLGSDYYDLQDFCEYVEWNTTCEVALLIVNDTGMYDLNTFAIKTFEKNGIGQEGQDNGVLVVFYVPEEGDVRWRTVTGAGVSDLLSGFVLKGFENDYLIPAMEEGDLSWGITIYIYAIGLELDEKYVAPHTDFWHGYPISFIPLKGWHLVAILIILIILTVVTRGRILLFIPLLFGGRGGFGGGKTGGGGSRGRF